MKKVLILLCILLLTNFLYSEGVSLKLGIQAASDSSMGILLKGDVFEFAVKAQIQLYDPGEDFLLAGAHLSWLIPLEDKKSAYGIGVDFRNGFASYIAEHVDMFLRLSYNYDVSEKFMITGIYSPILFSTRETEGQNDWGSVATFLYGSVALTMFF